MHIHSPIECRKVDRQPTTGVMERIQDLPIADMEIQPQEKSIQPFVLCDRERHVSLIFRRNCSTEIQVLKHAVVGDNVRCREVLDSDPQIEAASNLVEYLANVV